MTPVTMTTIRVGTRASLLARTQAEEAIRLLRAAHPGLKVDIVTIATTGDTTTGPLPRQDKGYFVKEIDGALLDGRIDVAVHSLKDMLTTVAEGLTLAAVPPRQPANDALVPRDPVVQSIEDLRPDSRIGTSSVRRLAELRRLRGDLKMMALRGNLDTRMRKLREGECDALIVAEAGLRRLGVPEPEFRQIPIEQCCPPAGQGALGLVTRNEPAIVEIVRRIEDPLARAAADTERTFLRTLGGGCQIPAGIHAETRGDGTVRLYGFVGTADGKWSVRGEISGPLGQGPAMAIRLAHDLLTSGGDEFLINARHLNDGDRAGAPEEP